ncbi:hypothetical protein BT96DRAFT_998253 [Gymnopus androsaceus JB14]|uniref:F-box domain-containing protein n=1 Tax=Gymnopus androsaceus JB14 TaxID=1447944 RepID=A0A6A4HCC1_9AGAR|nr:hypothetical protein BT96DRAFT_998253 [Gymnopus androsaceus JB14]
MSISTPAEAAEPSVINSFPSELLARIFHAGTELEVDDPRARPCLITYCSISSRWRTVCQLSPELWTNIRVPFHQTAHQDVVAWTATWLERSKSCLFDLTIDFPEPPSDSALSAAAQLLRDTLLTIIPHVARLRRLHFNAHTHYSLARPILNPLRVEAPQLIDLQLQFYLGDDFINMGPGYIIPYAFTSAPCLQRQSVRGVPLQFPLQGLTSLEIHGAYPEESIFRDLSLQSPGLGELVLTKLNPMLDPADNANSSIVFPALRALTVSFARKVYAPRTCILAFISPPNLTHLEIRGVNVPDPDTSLPNPAILTKLHTLCLEEVLVQHPINSSQSPTLPTFYLTLPSVKHLKLISTAPQPLFPAEPERKPLLRSRSGELRSRKSAGLLPHPSQPRAAEIDFRVLSRDKTQPVKLPFSPEAAASSSKPYPHWPNLTTITLDAIRARDLLWLCTLVATRSEIDTVYLSRSAKRHLASSLSIKRGDEKSKDVFSCWEFAERKPLVRVPQLEKGDIDPVQWLEERVKVFDFCRKERF